MIQLPMLDAEVLVVGGGPGGSAVALQLARRGHHVVVLDSATFPREKVCGEGLMPVGVAELERLGVRLDIDAQRFTGIGYRVGRARAVGRFPRGHHGLGLRRYRLDAALAKLCTSAGVERHHGTRVRSVGGLPGAMWVEADRRWRARAVIGADGMHSVVRKSLGLQRARRGRVRYGVRGHYRLAPGVEQIEVVEVLAERSFEVYLTPTGEREVNVALLLERNATRSLKGDLPAGFRALVDEVEAIRPLLQGAEVVSEPRLCGPLRQESTDVVADGAMLVGDAAGFLDGITGEGMSLTLLSAKLAAEVLSEGLRASHLHRFDLRPYARRRRWAGANLTLLTEIVLAGIRNRHLAKRVVRGLAKHPDVFERVLAVNAGVGSLRGVGLGGLMKVLL